MSDCSCKPSRTPHVSCSAPIGRKEVQSIKCELSEGSLQSSSDVSCIGSIKQTCSISCWKPNLEGTLTGERYMPHQWHLGYTSEAWIKLLIKSSGCLMRGVWQTGCCKTKNFYNRFLFIPQWSQRLSISSFIYFAFFLLQKKTHKTTFISPPTWQ